jgi:predicted transcriptional regulator of viral defense system
MSPRGAITVLVETAVDGLLAEFTVSELERICPGVSHGMICYVLDQLKHKGRLEHLGRRRAKSWRKKYLSSSLRALERIPQKTSGGLGS